MSKEKISKRTRQVLLFAAIAAGACLLLWGGLTLLRSAKRGAVQVYPVSDCSMGDYWGDTAQTSGTVTADRIQKVYLSGTQTVSAIAVSEGQTVRKGDRLLTYDTSLTALDVERGRIAVERAKLQLEEDKQELQNIINMQTKEALEQQKTALEEQLKRAQEDAGSGTRTPVQAPTWLSGSGTETDPAYYELPSGTALEQSLLETLLGGKSERLVALVYREGDIHEHPVTSCIGLNLVKDAGGQITVTPVTVKTWEDPATDPSSEVRRLQQQLDEINDLLDTSYTRAQLLRMESSKRTDIRNDEVQIGLAQVELRRLENEVSDGAVYAQFDGVVKAVRSPESVSSADAVVELSGGGGYYVDGAVSELLLDTVQVGQEVQISSWMTGASCTGQVVSIGTYPTKNTSYSDGNQNVSYYPLRVFVSEDADLKEGDYVDLSYQAAAQTGSSLYLKNMFVRTENGKSYVYVLGENGRLEKRTVQTGRDIWGSYTEIRGGLTEEDYVAFPYGRDVTDGAKTTQADISQLYSGY